MKCVEMIWKRNKGVNESILVFYSTMNVEEDNQINPTMNAEEDNQINPTIITVMLS